jgi:hypothetical protein
MDTADLKKLGLRGAIHQHTEDEPLVQGLIALKNGEEIKATSKADLFRLYKEAEAGGDLFKLRVSIVPHNQAGNANYWRILPKAYKPLAKSFSGMVFQRDHSLKQENRGGTILKSKAEGAGESAYMVQEIEIVEPWAIEGFLRGTIDRFSIQLNMHDIEAYCSICGASIYDWCSHWPGASYEVKGKEQVCWWEVHSGTGKETSAVTDPAVAGTYIQEIQQLAASLRGPKQQPSSEEEDPMKIEELQAQLASKEEELASQITALEEAESKIQALTQTIEQGAQELAETKESLEAAVSAESARADAVQKRFCADITEQINTLRSAKDNHELFENHEPLAFDFSAEMDLEAEEDKLRRLLLADQILVERELRHDGPDFDVNEQREKLMAKSADALALALEQWRLMPTLAKDPPMGKGATLRPDDGMRAAVEESAVENKKNVEEIDDFSTDDLASIATGKAALQ